MSDRAVADGFRQRVTELEAHQLVDWASNSYPAKRARAEDDCGLRTPYQRDRDRIVHSKAFRRLKHKTQVFISPIGDHYRTRLTHTLEATQVSRTVARALALNEDLTEAIGLGHDLGHAPFGHIGEQILNDCMQQRFNGHFKHNQHSLRVVDSLERDGEGLNLTEQVRDGILNHTSGTPLPATAEGQIVRIVDRIAYINHDIDDALRAGVIQQSDLPAEEISLLGRSGTKRIDRLVHDLVETSSLRGEICQSQPVKEAMLNLRSFMFKRVYLGEQAQHEYLRIQRLIRALFEHYSSEPNLIPNPLANSDLPQRVCDYIAGMTDRFCIRAFEELAVPRGFSDS